MESRNRKFRFRYRWEKIGLERKRDKWIIDK